MGDDTCTRQKPDHLADPRAVRVVQIVRRDGTHAGFYAGVDRWLGGKKLYIRVLHNEWWNMISKTLGKEENHFVVEIRERSPEAKVAAICHLTKNGGGVTLQDLESEVNSIYNNGLKRLLRRINREGRRVGVPVLDSADQS